MKAHRPFWVLRLPVVVVTMFLATTAAFGEAVVTLKSGEVLRGDFISDTNDVVAIRAYNANRTISSRRDIPRSDIQDFQNETPVQAAERIDYFALSKFRLDPDQEQSSSFYNQWIAAFEKFQSTYPKSDKNTVVQQHIDDCQAELKHITAGEAKFENGWMSPAEKKPRALSKQLTESENQREALAKTIAKLQADAQGGQAHLASLQDSIAPVYATRIVHQDQYVQDRNAQTVFKPGESHYGKGAQGHYVDNAAGTEQYDTGRTQTVPNPERPGIIASITSIQRQIGSDQVTLSSLDAKIQSLKVQMPQAEHAYEASIAPPQTPAPPPVVAQAPAPMPSAPTPPPQPEPLSWYKRLWNWL
jgi:hypothetical protein